MRAEILDTVLTESWQLFAIFTPRLLGGAAAGFLLALVAAVMLGRRGLFVRRPRAWNVLAKLHYLYLFLLLLCAGAAFGGVFAAHRYADRLLDDRLLPLAKTQAPALREFLQKRVDWGADKDVTLEGAVGRILAALTVEPASPAWGDQARATVINYLTQHLGKWVVSAGLSSALTYALGEAAAPIGVSKDTVKFSVDVVKNLDLSKLDQSVFALLTQATHEALAHLFRALHLDVALLLLAGLAIPGVELTVYFAWYRRRRAVSPV